MSILNQDLIRKTVVKELQDIEVAGSVVPEPKGSTTLF